MAFRTWGRVLLAAVGVAFLAGAGQLGFAYGLGVVRFARSFDRTGNLWAAQLTWVSWFAMVATVAGAYAADRLARRYDHPASTVLRVCFAGVAALGASVVAPLVMQPARAARGVPGDPVLAAGTCAALGAALGILVAVAVLLRPQLGWSVTAVTGALWLIALVSVLPSLGPRDPLPAVRLGVVEPVWFSPGTTQRLAVLTLPLVCLVLGLATGGLSRWLGRPPVMTALSGVSGPLLPALAHVVAGPGTSADRYQAAPYWAALIAVCAGALGSVLVAVLRWPLVPASARTGTGPGTGTAPSGDGPSATSDSAPGSDTDDGATAATDATDPAPDATHPVLEPTDILRPIRTGQEPLDRPAGPTEQSDDAPVDASGPPTAATSPPAAETAEPPSARTVPADPDTATEESGPTDRGRPGDRTAGPRTARPGSGTGAGDGWDVFAAAGRALAGQEPAAPTEPANPSPETTAGTADLSGPAGTADRSAPAGASGGSAAAEKARPDRKPGPVGKAGPAAARLTGKRTGPGDGAPVPPAIPHDGGDDEAERTTADPSTPESGPERRRGLFRRRRSAPTPVPAPDSAGTDRRDPDRVPPDEKTGTPDDERDVHRRARSRKRDEDEPVPAQDEEYVDWVSGLASEPTGRHHRASSSGSDRPA